MSTANRRGMGRGLAAILPQPGEVTEPTLRHVPPALILPNPTQPRRRFDAESIASLAESLRSAGPDPAADRSPALRRALRDHRRRAPLARGTRGGARDHSGRPSRRGRGASHGDGADRERRPRAAQPGRRGARLRHAGRGPRPDEGGAGPPPRPKPRRAFQPDPDPRPARRGARAPGGRRPDRGPRPRDPDREVR